MRQSFTVSVAGDSSYILTHSNLSRRNWFIKNTRTSIIVWNGAFDSADQAIEAAYTDGFEFIGAEFPTL